MRPLYFCLLLSVIILCLVGCSPCAEDEADMVEMTREHLPLAEAETLFMESVGRIDRDKSSLLVIRTGEDEQKKNYFPVSFEQTARGYRLKHLARSGMYERGEGLYTYSWHDGYLFLVDNRDCVRLLFKDELDNETEVLVESYPFVYYLEDAFEDLDGNGQSQLSYAFLDRNGEALG